MSGLEYRATTAAEPDNAAGAHARHAPPMGSCAFFSPRLPPMLYGRTRHTYPVGAPEGPTGGGGGPAILRHHPPAHTEYPVGGTSGGPGPRTPVNSAVVFASGTSGRGGGEQASPRGNS